MSKCQQQSVHRKCFCEITQFPHTLFGALLQLKCKRSVLYENQKHFAPILQANAQVCDFHNKRDFNRSPFLLYDYALIVCRMMDYKRKSSYSPSHLERYEVRRRNYRFKKMEKGVDTQELLNILFYFFEKWSINNSIIL